MSDKKDLLFIIAKLAVLSESIINKSQELKSEVINLKKFFKEFKKPKKTKKFTRTTLEFFNSFLKPSLEKENLYGRKEIIKDYLELNKKISEQMIGYYLRELEHNNYIKSEINSNDRRKKIYRLSMINV